MGLALLRGALAVLLVVGVSSARTAHASPSAKLTYVRGQGAESCPDEATLRKEVAARLGFDVFFPWARRTVVAEISKGPRGFRARLQVLGEDGVVLGVRSIDATSQSCLEVAHALALAMSIAVDDFGLDDVAPPAAEPSPHTPEPTPEKPLATPPPPPSTEPPPPAVPPRRSLPIEVSLGPIVSFEVAPAASVGLRGEVDVTLWRWLSLGLDLRGDLPASGGDVQTYVLVASLVPCARIPAGPLAVDLCGVISAGDFHETGVDISSSTSRDAPYVALAPRVRLILPLGRRFFVSAHTDAAFVLLRHKVTVAGATHGNGFFELPLIAPSLGLSGGVAF